MREENVPNRHQTAREVSILLGVLGIPSKEGIRMQEHRYFCCMRALPSGKGPSLPHPCGPVGLSRPGAQVPLTQKQVWNPGRAVRLAHPSGTVIGPEGACDPTGRQPSQISGSQHSL